MNENNGKWRYLSALTFNLRQLISSVVLISISLAVIASFWSTFSREQIYEQARTTCLLGDLTTIKLLFENRQVSCDYRSIKDTTLLLLASKNGHVDVMEFLIQQGADVNEKGRHDQTPLMWAAMGGHSEATKLLLANGANMNDKDDSERNAQQLASENNHIEVETILDNANKQPND